MLSWLNIAWFAMFYRLRRLFEYLQSVLKYYRWPDFRKVDLALVTNYLRANPYHVARRFAELQGEKVLHTYGETPLLTLEKVAHRCGMTHQDVVLELGCGRARTCFWLATVWGCKTIGVDNNPYFIRIAERIAHKYHIQNLEFRCEDLLHTDLSDATVIYLYGSAFDSDFIRQLAARMGRLPKQTSIITVSYPMQNYAQKPLFELVESFELPFTWGLATIYWQRVR